MLKCILPETSATSSARTAPKQPFTDKEGNPFAIQRALKECKKKNPTEKVVAKTSSRQSTRGISHIQALMSRQEFHSCVQRLAKQSSVSWYYCEVFKVIVFGEMATQPLSLQKRTRADPGRAVARVFPTMERPLSEWSMVQLCFMTISLFRWK